MAEAWLAARYNRPGHKIVDHYTYAICGDGDLMEGVSQEAASLAGHLRLGKLIYLYDQNHISLAGATEIDFTEDVAKRFEACGWHTRVVPDGNDTEDVASAIREAQAEDQRPSLILARTHIGYGSPHKQDNFSAHGDPLGEDELQATKKALGWPTMEKFYLPQDSVEYFRQAVPHGAQMEDEWRKKFDAYKQAFPKEAAEFESIFSGKLPQNWDADLPKWKPTDKPMATRAAAGEVMNALAKHIPNLIGGSADLNPSTGHPSRVWGFPTARSVGPGNVGRGRRGVELCRAEHCFRRSRARHGNRRERHGRARRCDSLQRNVFQLFRLHEARHPPGGLEPSQGDLRIYARQHRAR